MTLVLGVDPGNTGAFAVYCSDTRAIVSVDDMPVWFQTVGKRKRKRIDALAIADMFDTYELMGVELVVIEAVRARPKQSGMFTFGYGVGLIYMAAVYSKIPIESVPPETWKKLMNVPGKSKADDTAIMARVAEIFPNDMGRFAGPQGGKRVDRAEAAMMAKFGAENVLHSLNQLSDAELRIAYRNNETGA